MYSPWDGEIYWGVCNTIGDESSRVATHLSKAELEVFFKILEELQDSDGEMSVVDAQNVYTERKLPVAETGRIIQKLHQMQWLKITRRPGEARLTPGARAIIELPQVRQWTRDVGREMRQRERERGQNRVSAEDEESEDETVRRGKKRRSSQVESERGEDDEIEESVMPVRRGGAPRAVRRGGRRSSRI